MPVEASSDRVLPVQELLDECLVYDCNTAFLLVFVITKVAAPERNAHHIEIPGAAIDRNGDRQIARSCKLRAFDINGAAVVIEAEREVISQRSAFDLRQRLGTLQHLLLKRASALLVISLQADIERNRHRVFRIEPGPHLLSGLQTPNDKARTDEED